MRMRWAVNLVWVMSISVYADSMYSDSFTGPDLDVQWQSINGTWTVNNGVTVTDPTEGTAFWNYGIKSASDFGIDGDFDIRIDMQPISNTGNYGYDRFQFRTNDGSIMQFEVYHNSSSSSAVYRGTVGAVTGSNYTTTDLTAYSIRLVRAGLTASVYVAAYQSTDWVEIASGDFSLDSGTVWAIQSWPANAGDNVLWSNFQVVSNPDQVGNVTFSPSGMYITGPTDVEVSCETSGATIYYTTDGNTPTSGSAVYDGTPIPVSEGITLTVVAMADGYSPRTASVTYKEYTPNVICSDSFPGPELHPQWQSVNGSWSIDDGITIIDPSSGTAWWPYGIKSASGYELSGDFDIRIDMKPISDLGNWGYDRFQFKTDNGAILELEVYHNSSSSTAVYRGIVGSVAGSNYDTSDLTSYSLRLVRTGFNASVYVAAYQTTDWVEIASGAFSVDSGSVVIVQAWPADAGDQVLWSNFQVMPNTQATADLQFSPGSEYISENTDVTLTSSTSGATIHYTTDGSIPTASSATYSGPISVSDGMTLTAVAIADGYNPNIISKTYVQLNRPASIVYGSATVDGDLSDWANANWAPLDTVSELGTSVADVEADVPEAYYAARWQAHKLYVAVKVYDNAHWFTDEYTDWDVRDAIEVFVHTADGGATNYVPYNTTAQQYAVGITSYDPDTVWATVGSNGSFNLTGYSDVAFAAGQECTDGKWLYYEMVITPFDYLGVVEESGDMSTSIVSTLVTDQVIGLDVDIICHTGAKYLGKKSENIMQPRYNNWENFGLHQLAAPIQGDANNDGKVDVGDLGILAANYGMTSGAIWSKGDFTGDGKVDVGDLGVLAANYGTVLSGSSNFEADYAKVFGLSATSEDSDDSAETDTENMLCSSLGLSLMAGLALLGLMLVKLDE